MSRKTYVRAWLALSLMLFLGAVYGRVWEMIAVGGFSVGYWAREARKLAGAST